LRLFLLLAAWLATATLAQAAPPLEAYGKLPGVEFMALSPRGERIAMVVRHGGTQSLLVATSNAVAETQVSLGSQNLRRVFWAGDDYVVMLGSASINAPALGFPRQEWMGAGVLNLKTGKALVIFDKSRTMLGAVFGWYGAAEVDGRWYAYVGGVTYEQVMPTFNPRPIQPNLYRVDLDTGEAVQISQAGAGDSDWAVNAQGEVVARSAFDTHGEVFQVRAGAKGGAVLHSARNKEGVNAIEILGLGRRADTVLLSEEGASGRILRELPVSGGAGEVLSQGDNTAYALRDPISHLVIGMVSDSGAKIEMYDPALQKRVEMARRAFRTKRSYIASADSGMTHMLVHTEGAGDSGTYWNIDIAAKSATPIGFEYPAVHDADVGESRMFAYKAADGLPLEGALTLPGGRPAKGLPLVILPHGGPIVPGDQPGFDWMAQAFASRGYAVLQPNYRGTLGYGEDFRRAAQGEWGRKMQTDLSDGVSALAAEGLVDPKRVCIVGASYGGYAALAGVTLQKDIYRCAVSVAPVTDLPKFIVWVNVRQQGDSRARRFWTELVGASSGPGAADISPARQADKAQAPILLIHGADDTVVPIEQSKMMERALKGAGKPVQMVTLKGEDHWLSDEPSRIALLNAAVTFVEQHNPPD